MDYLSLYQQARIIVNTYLCRLLGCIENYKINAPLHKGWNETEHKCSRCGCDYVYKYYQRKV